jgi:CDP-paratose 2-epimerase
MTGRGYLVTGGAGFIGANYVHRLLTRGERVVILDNLSRHGASLNVEWLQAVFGKDRFTLVVGDLRDAEIVRTCAKDADVIVHLGGQVAVTTSMQDPRGDFEANALGTLNTLEAARSSGRDPIVIYASTNKVYGPLADVAVVEDTTRWRYQALPDGCAEHQSLDFASPYGCSKGAGDQYVRDYARIYGLRTIVFRQSCIYGPRQFGIDGQGWLAWMMLTALEAQRMKIYGDGKQTRDVLYVDDLLDAYDAAVSRIDDVAGQVFNIGGGRDNVLAVWAEFGPMLEGMLGRPIAVEYGPWRPGDQRVFYADITKARRELSWEPAVGLDTGVRRLFEWVKQHRVTMQWQ